MEFSTDVYLLLLLLLSAVRYSPSVDLSSSRVRDACDVVVARGGRGWVVGRGDAGLGADPTEPALLG